MERGHWGKRMVSRGFVGREFRVKRPLPRLGGAWMVRRAIGYRCVKGGCLYNVGLIGDRAR